MSTSRFCGGARVTALSLLLLLGTAMAGPAPKDSARLGGADGTQLGVYPSSDRPHGHGGPRGLLRVWVPGGRWGHSLINFIAVEPTTADGRKGFSELETSRLDHTRGLRMTVEPGGDEHHRIIRVERFKNGAHVYLDCSQRADAPEEVVLQVRREPDSAPLRECVLTATWGNLTRSRLLWLRHGSVESRQLYPGFHGNGFAPDRLYPLQDMRRVGARALVALSCDESDPARVHPQKGSDRWVFAPGLYTQYWAVDAPAAGLRVRVNGRAWYWNSHVQIPGGVAFENFEVRQPFVDRQTFVFGATRRTPQALGFSRAGQR